MPANILDLYIEYRAHTNCDSRSRVLLGLGAKDGLFDALGFFGHGHRAHLEKKAMRDRILAGPPFTSEERREILDYCRGDVEDLELLLPELTAIVSATAERWGLALYHGLYTKAAAQTEHWGVPLDPFYDQLREHAAALRPSLIEEMDTFGFYEKGSFRNERFLTFVRERLGITWQRTPCGRAKFGDNYLRDMAKVHPTLELFHQLYATLNQIKLGDLAVGSDWRNRASLAPYRAVTGRNQPSNSGFIFGPAVWLRSFIRPPPGKALANLDWKTQEPAIGAAYSGDKALMAAVQTSDMYTAFLLMVGSPIPTNPVGRKRLRQMSKVLNLAIIYGKGVPALAAEMNISEEEAAHWMALHRSAYPVLHAWLDGVVREARETKSLATCFDWTLHITKATKPNTVRNYLFQATGSEMMRLAHMRGIGRGLKIVAPVHDAFLIEADAADIHDHVAEMQASMDWASREVLDGFTVRVDPQIVLAHEHYTDERGEEMFGKVVNLLL